MATAATAATAKRRRRQAAAELTTRSLGDTSLRSITSAKEPGAGDLGAHAFSGTGLEDPNGYKIFRRGSFGRGRECVAKWSSLTSRPWMWRDFRYVDCSHWIILFVRHPASLGLRRLSAMGSREGESYDRRSNNQTRRADESRGEPAAAVGLPPTRSSGERGSVGSSGGGGGVRDNRSGSTPPSMMRAQLTTKEGSPCARARVR